MISCWVVTRWLIALDLLSKKWIKDYHWQSEDVSPEPAWSIFLNLCQYFSVHSFILAFSMIFKHGLITGLCDSYWVGKEFSLWVPMWRRPCRQELLLAILSVWARRDFHVSADWIPFVWWISQYTIYILTVQKFHLQPLRDCLYLNRADLS